MSDATDRDTVDFDAVGDGSVAADVRLFRD
jgi:hypothetical protein